MFPNDQRWDVVVRILKTRGYLMPDEIPDDQVIEELCDIGWLRRDDAGRVQLGLIGELHVNVGENE